MSGTTSPYDTYTSPLAERNASPEMLRLWSARHKFNTWRRIWLAVAEAQHEVTAQGAPGASPGSGAPLVTKEQVEELRAVVERKNADGTVGITDAEIELAKKYERELRHDVMAHVHALGDACPKARAIIHLGMTSQDVVCNADLLIVHTAYDLIRTKMARCILSFGAFAASVAGMATLGLTHYQAAQPVTVGRRAAGWASDLDNLRDMGLTHFRMTPVLRGFKGATGTQASFLNLFAGDSSTVDRFEAIAIFKTLQAGEPLAHGYESFDALKSSHRTDREELARAGFAAYVDAVAQDGPSDISQVWDEHTYIRITTLGLTGQTYPRSYDTLVLSFAASVAAVLHKIATDIRLLCNRKELDEPFEDKQIGSSAMPYKRNPMRCERICGLCRFVMNLVGNAYDTAATQWLERTLDDSSNRRLSLPEAFLALDGALDLMHNVASGLIVHEAMVRKNLMAELPFMATENILMACVKLGGDRQHYHELIRVHAQAAGMRVKHEGLDNDLIDRLKNDRAFWSTARGGPLSGELDWNETGEGGKGGLLDPMRYIGRSVEQTERFIKEVVEPLRQQYGEAIAKLGESGPRV